MEAEGTKAAEVRTVSWPGYLLGAYAVLAGSASVLFENYAAPGWAIYTRPILGIIGVAGGLLLLLRDRWWKAVLGFWLLAQIPVMILDPSGELTRQQGIDLSFRATGQVSWKNGVLVGIQAYGVNVATIALLWLGWRISSRGCFAQGPRPGWMRFCAGTIQLALAALLVVMLFAGWRRTRVWVEKDLVVMVDALPPGTEVYAGAKKLGVTPVAITGRKMVELGLSPPGGPNTWRLEPLGNDSGLELVGSKSRLPISFKPPSWSIGHMQTMRTPEGIRAMLLAGYPLRSSSNYFRMALAPKARPGLVLSEEGVNPAVCEPNEKVEFTVKLRCNPPNLKAPPEVRREHGNRARLTVAIGESPWKLHEVHRVELPAAFAEVIPGQEVRHTFQLPAPQKPGNYIIAYRQAFFFENTDGSKTNDVWSPNPRAYGWLQVKPGKI